MPAQERDGERQLPAKPLVASTDMACRRDDAGLGYEDAAPNEMVRLDEGIPANFVVNGKACDEFMDKNRLQEVFEGLRDGLMRAVEVDQPLAALWAAAQMRQIILGAPVPENVRESVEQAYEKIGQGPVEVSWTGDREKPSVSPFASRHPKSWRAGGVQELLQAIQACWASHFQAQAASHRRGATCCCADEGSTIVVRSIRANSASSSLSP